MPLQQLVQQDAVDEAAEADAEQQAGSAQESRHDPRLLGRRRFMCARPGPAGPGPGPTGPSCRVASRRADPTPMEVLMFKHVDYLQFQAKPEKPDALLARKMQELVGGQFGEMTVMMQYLWQGWSCRVPGKYKDMIMDIVTEEIGHVEMLTTMLARLLEAAPGEATEKAAAANPVLAAVLGGMSPQHAIVSGGGALPRDSEGTPWNTGYIVASGNLLSDFRSNVAAEAQSRLMTSRVYN